MEKILSLPLGKRSHGTVVAPSLSWTWNDDGRRRRRRRAVAIPFGGHWSRPPACPHSVSNAPSRTPPPSG
jgi:hypothetical protein